MAEPLIETVGLVKDYHLGARRIHALRGVSMRIQPGEFVAVMGPSGSGKSTFMNLMGRDALAKVRNEKIGFVFQTFNLLPRTSALENVELPLLYCATLPRDRQARARAKLASVGLSDREHHHPAQLSGGQQQRVAIARALINEPVLILADEPTGALDSRTSVEIMALFQDLNREGITIVVVTHEPDIARYAHRILSFRDGHLTRDEPVAERLIARELLATLPGGAEPAEEEDAETEVTPS
jgi:putative ABC transport system ATP-binding protein